LSVGLHDVSRRTMADGFLWFMVRRDAPYDCWIA
jgi:hypothetical protein